MDSGIRCITIFLPLNMQIDAYLIGGLFSSDIATEVGGVGGVGGVVVAEGVVVGGGVVVAEGGGMVVGKGVVVAEGISFLSTEEDEIGGNSRRSAFA